MPSCGDHSSKKGKMLVVNGAEIPNVKIWSQTIGVKPNTTYIFSTWLQHVTSSNPARLQFSINNTSIGPVFKANNLACIWDNFYSTWHSGKNTMATISIINKSREYTGNDFTIDDIYFGVADEQPPPADCSNKASARFEFKVTDCFNSTFRLTEKKNKRLTGVSWNFGDGSIGNGSNPSHRYKKYGNYKVTAIVSSRPSCTDTFTRIVQIKPAKTAFGITEQGQPGKIAFTAIRNGHTLAWDFGDGLKGGDESIVVHQYTESGDYISTLTATSAAGCRDSFQKSIAILLPEKMPAGQPAITGPSTAVALPAAQLEKRNKEIIRTIEVVQDSITVLLYDNGIIDGDSITLLLDDQVLLIHQLLARTPLQLRIPVSRDKESHELTMYAENLGSIPPNTAYMVIMDGTVKYEVYISSSKKSNGVVLFTRRPPD